MGNILDDYFRISKEELILLTSKKGDILWSGGIPEKSLTSSFKLSENVGLRNHRNHRGEILFLSLDHGASFMIPVGFLLRIGLLIVSCRNVFESIISPIEIFGSYLVDF